MSHGTTPHHPLLLVEDLLLLLTDDVNGSTVATSHLPVLLGGALLSELALDGTAVLDPKAGRGLFAGDRVVAVRPPFGSPARDTAEPDPMLARAWSIVAEKPRAPSDVVARLGKGAKDEVATRLARRGILERVDSKVLGLFPRTRWPAADMTHERAVRERLHACLVVGLMPEPRIAALIGLLDTVDHLHTAIHSDLPRKELKRRAKAISQGGWATDAVRKAVEATNAAVMAGLVTTTVAATS